MNNIGIGIFCFGEEKYFKGTIEKLNQFISNGFHCYVLTDNPNYFKDRYTDTFFHTIPYKRKYKSYHDKMILSSHIIDNHDIAILIDADTNIVNSSFINQLKTYTFKKGISYIDTLLNHSSKYGFIKDLKMNDLEWESYKKYVNFVYPNYGEHEMIWEYFLVINKDGLNDNFFNHYEKLQLAKEHSDLLVNKEVNGAGEGISITIASILSNTNIQRDVELYNLIKEDVKPITRHTPRNLWPKFML